MQKIFFAPFRDAIIGSVNFAREYGDPCCSSRVLGRVFRYCIIRSIILSCLQHTAVNAFDGRRIAFHAYSKTNNSCDNNSPHKHGYFVLKMVRRPRITTCIKYKGVPLGRHSFCSAH